MDVLRGLALALALVFGPGSAVAVTLDVVGGQLIGASGVDVDGTLYDVAFVDGTCIALFSGCDEVSDFTFNTFGEGTDAAQALLDQVFVDGVDGLFDTDPELTTGCTSTTICHVLTPLYPSIVPDEFVAYVASNSEGVDLSPSGAPYERADDFSGFPGHTFAVWTAVPEPSTGLLLASGFAWWPRRKRQDDAR